MNFIEKNGLKIKLQNTSVPEADEALLKEKNPQAKPLQSSFFDNDRKKKEILWALLDVATEEEIVANRKKYQEEPSGESHEKLKKEVLAEINEALKSDISEERIQELKDQYQETFDSDLDDDLIDYGFIKDPDSDNPKKPEPDKKPEPEVLTAAYLNENFNKKEIIEKYGEGLDVTKKDNKKTIIAAVLDSKKKQSENNQENQDQNPEQ